MRIKALTMWQPWASLVAIGAKRYETRDWGTKYRGWLAIHAAKRWRVDQRQVLMRPPYRVVLREAGFNLAEDCPFPLGQVVAVVRLRAIYKAESVAEVLRGAGKSRELAFGDFRHGRYAWHLHEVQRLKKPRPATGARSLWWWDVPARLATRLRVEEVKDA